MKKTLLIALLLIPFLGISQTTKPVDGFLGIKFGSSRAEVAAALNAKGGIINKAQSTPNLLSYKNIKLGHRNAAVFLVKFFNNKAFEADFLFDAEMDAKTLEYYKELVSDINENYGKGQENNKYQEPYNAEDDDGIKINAIQNGKAEFETVWESSPTKNTISTSISTELTVVLTYQDSNLADQAINNQKSKEKADF